jgi:hypothetical protein
MFMRFRHWQRSEESIFFQNLRKSLKSALSACYPHPPKNFFAFFSKNIFFISKIIVYLPKYFI